MKVHKSPISGEFEYCVVFGPLKTEPNFSEVRAWMWDTWGPSKELNSWNVDFRKLNGITPIDFEKLHCFNQHWCWDTGSYKEYLYLKGEKELMLFKLRWQ